MVDYSGWKTIELSSDEDDVHPFIENGTLFRLRHEARLKKMQDRKNKEFALECHKASYKQRFEKLKNRIGEKSSEGVDIEDLQVQMRQLEIEEKEIKSKEDKLNKQVVAWYIDTICHPGFSKMFVNATSSEDDASPEKFNAFVSKNKSLLKQFGLLQNFEQTKQFLIANPHLIKKHSLYFLISYGVRMYLKGELTKLKTISRQIVCLQHVLELFKMFNKNTKDLLCSFFVSIKLADDKCKSDFEKETSKVENLITELVGNKLQEIDTSPENSDQNDETQFVLDPEYVMEHMPEEMQYCFMMKDKEALVRVLSSMPEEEAERQMRRCIASGLWIPERNQDE